MRPRRATRAQRRLPRSPSPVLLAKWILPKTTASLDSVDHILLAGPANGGIRVALAQSPSTIVAEREWKEGSDYRCERGWLLLQLESILIPPFGYFTDARLARTADGQLVVESTRAAFGVAPPLVPVIHHDSQWHLYPLVAP